MRSRRRSKPWRSIGGSLRARGRIPAEGEPTIDRPAPGAEVAMMGALQLAEAYLADEGFPNETIVLSAYLVVDGETVSAVKGGPAETPRQMIQLLFWSAHSIAQESGLV